jgi:nucleotide-binding universal stress UspA family protein
MTVAPMPAKVALAEAACRAELLVLGSAQASAVHLFSPVGRRTAAVARCPVAIVPAHRPSGALGTGGHLVVGMDDSSQSAAALQWACAEAQHRRLPLRVVTVGLHSFGPPTMHDAIAQAQRAFPSVQVTLEIRVGDPAEVLARESAGAEALVLGQHGNGWVTRQLPALGSVSRWFAANPVCPVVIVPAAPVGTERD